MPKKESYKRLYINRDQIEAAIIDFFSNKNDGNTDYKISKLKHLNGVRHRMEFIYIDDQLMIDFLFNNDGTTTIVHSVGKPNSIKVELADYIKYSPICTIEKINGMDEPWFVFDDYKHDDFFTALAIAKENKGVSVKKSTEINGGKQWVLKSKTGEEVTISFYKKNSKAVIQGKPLPLFNEIYITLITLLNVEEVPKIMNQQIKIAEKVTYESIEKELEFYLPNSFNNLSDKMRILSYQSIFNLKITDDMFDYTFLTFPSLKLLEGHLKYIMKNKCIPLEDDKFSMFRRISRNPDKFILHPDFHPSFKDSEKNSVEHAYTFYNIHRHSIFHWANIDGPIANKDSTIVHQRADEAHGIIINSLEIIDTYYS